MPVSISKILKDKELSLKQFLPEAIKALENRIQEKDLGEGVKPYTQCIIRNKEIMIKPEEIIRQLFTEKLMNEYGYPKENIVFEHPIKSVGRQKDEIDFADIVVFTDSSKSQAYIIFEIKRPDDKDEKRLKDQLKSYCLVEGASIGALINGDGVEKYYVNNVDEKSKTRNLQEISVLPKYGEDLEDVLDGERKTLKYLIKYDRLRKETLKTVITELEQRFSANDSSDKSFDELLKLIYCKLYDEFNHNDDADYISRDIKRMQKKNASLGYYEALENVDDDEFATLEFRAKYHEDENDVFKRIEKLFNDAQNNWKGAFAPNTKLDMQPSTVKSCVLEFQNVKLFNSNLEIVDEAFEYLVNKNQKEEMGQYFTPRYVIDMCVKMLNPKKEETMIDTASGSCGFPMHTILHVWNKRDNLTTAKREQWEKDYVRDKVFAIDFSEKAVRVGKILNIITGDGNSNVLYLNTLDYDRWEKQFKMNPDWWAKYNEGFTRLEGLRADNNSYEKFNFDILMANPPFAGDLDDEKILSKYRLSRNKDGKLQNKVGRDILFIERNLNFLRPGGRMAIVLPQGRFNNSSDKYIRDFIADQCRILAVVGLHVNTFKKHTSTKTSVLFVQKWTDENGICPKKDDYNIFFATMREPSKENSGDKIYVTEHYFEVTHYTYQTIKKYYFENKEVSKDKYEILIKDKAQKRSCKSKIETITNTDIKTYREDEYEDIYGAADVNLPKKWVLKMVKFVLKPAPKGKLQDSSLKKEINVKEYIELLGENRIKYKVEQIIGNNTNEAISYEEYNSLTSEEKKYYVPIVGVNDYTERVKDTHGHIFVKHDLYNHDPKLEPKGRYCKDGIAEAFEEFAKKEGLSFFLNSPFNEANYNALLEGLEIRVVTFSKVLKDIDLRLESEFYNSKNVIYKSTKGSNIESFSQYGTSKDLNEEKRGFPVLRLNEFDSFFISEPSKYCDLISKETFELLKLKKDDVLICRTNGNPRYVGKAAVVPKDYDYAFASYVYRLRPNKDIINSSTLVAFMNSKYGRIEIEKFSMVGNQANFSPAKFRQISVPIFTKGFNLKIETIVYGSFKLLEESKSYHTQAENLLYGQLGIKRWEPRESLHTIKKFRDFAQSGRLDAEYYQSKYDDIERLIKNYNYDTLNNLCLLINHGMQPPYVENGEMRVFSQKWIKDSEIDYSFIEDNNEPRTNMEFALNNPEYVCRKNDIVHYSVGSNIGYCHTYLSDVPMMPGSFITLIRADEKKINPIYLGVVLNSIVGRMQSEKRKSGTGQPYIYPKDLKEFLIPILPSNLQQEIAGLVQKSFDCKKESKQLLQNAVQLVENEIETNETF